MRGGPQWWMDQSNTDPLESGSEPGWTVSLAVGDEAGLSDLRALIPDIEKSDFAKLREVAVTYTVPNSWARAVKMSRLSLTAAGRNLLTITDYTGVDPELNSQGQASNFGTSDFLTQPPVRSFILRLNASF